MTPLFFFTPINLPQQIWSSKNTTNFISPVSDHQIHLQTLYPLFQITRSISKLYSPCFRSSDPSPNFISPVSDHQIHLQTLLPLFQITRSILQIRLQIIPQKHIYTPPKEPYSSTGPSVFSTLLHSTPILLLGTEEAQQCRKQLATVFPYLGEC